MSKTLKKGIFLLIITLGVLFLTQTCVNATTIDSVEALKDLFEGKDATIEGTTITLTGDVELKNPNWTEGSTEIEFQVMELKDDEYVLDLNGRNLKIFDLYINEGTTLTIKDTKGGGLISNNGGSVVVATGGNLTINNGTMDYLANEGTTVINNATIGYINNYGTITIQKGSFNGIWQMGTAKINGGTFIAKKTDDFEYISNFNLDASTTTFTGGEFTTEGEQENALILTSNNSIEYTAFNKLLETDYKVDYQNTYTVSYPPTAEGEAYYCEAFFGKTVKISQVTEYEKNLIKKIAPDGKNATLKTVKPKDLMEAEFILTNVVNKILNEEQYFAYAWCPDEDFSKSIIEITGNGFNGIYDINIIYDEPKKNSYVQTFIDNLKKFEETPESAYQVTDLGLINYYMTSSKSELWNAGAGARALRYSDEIIELSKGGNIKFYLDVRAGEQGEELLFENAFGEMTVFYNDYAYGNKQQGIHLKRVIYIPQNTANSPEAYAQAAQKRINEYLGEENLVSVKYGGKLDSLEEEMLDPSVPIESTDGNYYNITVKGRTYKFYIMKGSEEQIEQPVYQGKDVDTNVEIKSTDANVPLDTSVKAIKVKNDNIKEILKTENYEAYEISLYSDAKGTSIEKLENGKFIVNIPVPEMLKDKKITAYYINSNGEKEEHIATVKDGIAAFETNHFSTYVLAEKEDKQEENSNNNNEGNITENTNTESKDNDNTNLENIKNPQTGDNIIFFVGMLAISLIGITVTTKIENKRK